MPHKLNSLWVQVIISQLQVVVVAKLSEDRPGGFVSAPLDKQGVQEQET